MPLSAPAQPQLRREIHRSRADAIIDPARQAYQMLHWLFAAMPTLMGIDKFFHRVTNWTDYLAPGLLRLCPAGEVTFVRAIGAVEIAIGLLVAVRPRVGAYVAAVWLVALIAELFIVRGFGDIIVRDVALVLCAVAFARLANVYDPTRVR